MAPSRAAAVLSSNDLNSRLAAKKYAPLFSDVKSHLTSSSGDTVSAGKVLTALAYHFYHNQLTDKVVVGEASTIVSTALGILESAKRAAPKSLDRAAAEKAAAAASNLVFKGFLRDCWLEATRAVAGAVCSFLHAIGDPDQAALYASVESSLVGSAIAVLRCGHKDASRDARRLLRANGLAHQHLPTRSLALHVLRLELGLLVARYAGPENAEEANAAFTSSCEFVDGCSAADLQKEAVSVSLADRLFVLAAKFGEAYGSSTKARAPLTELLSNARSLLLRSVKSGKLASPSPRTLGVWYYLFEIKAPSDQEEGERLLSELSAMALKGGKADMWLGAVEHCKMRLRYQRLRWKMEEEAARRAATAAATEASAEAASEASDVRNIGDVNPHASGLDLAVEEELSDEALKCMDHLEKGLSDWASQDPGTGPPPPLPMASPIVLKMLLTTAELLRLLGRPAPSIRAAKLALDAAGKLKLQPYAAAALSTLLRQTTDVKAHDSRVKQALATLRESSAATKVVLPSLSVAVGLARAALRRGHSSQASRLSGTLLRRARGLAASSSDVSGKILCAEACLLMASLRSLAGANVVFPAPGGDLPEWCGGLRDSMECGPLEFVTEAYRHSATAVHYAAPLCNSRAKVKASGSWCDLGQLLDVLRSSSVHREVLKARLDLASAAGMPKEMRLYAKLGLEFAQGCAAPLLVAEALAAAAHVDLACEDVDQAGAKLRAAGVILGPDAAGGGIGLDQGRLSKSKAVNHLGASPAHTVQEFQPPPWTGHNQAECDCYPCANPLARAVAVSYLNLKGAVLHATGDLEAAGRYFDGTAKLWRLLLEGLGEAEEEGLLVESAVLMAVSALQWQVECFGRDEYLTRCRDALAEQAKLLRSWPELMARREWLRTRLCHASLFLEMDEAGERGAADLSGLEERLSRATLLSPRPAAGLSPSCYKTPAPEKRAAGRTMAALPKRPTKKLLPPPSSSMW